MNHDGGRFSWPSGLFTEIRKRRILYLMFLPVALYYLCLAYFPMAGIVVAFKEFNYRDGLFLSPWNGWKNFEYLIASGKLLQVTEKTILFNAVFLALYLVSSLLVAVLLAELRSKFFKRVASTSLFLPYFVSWVVVAAFVYNFFNFDYGLINNVLKTAGLAPVNIYAKPLYWYFLLPFLYVWKWVGFGSVIFLAAIVGIDPECYEAADIDGAGAWQKIRLITLPQLKPMIVILLLLGIGRIMRGEFDMFWQLIGNNGLLIDSTDIIDTLVFRSLMGTQDFGMSSAAGFYQSVLCFAIIVIINALVRRYDPDYALF